METLKKLSKKELRETNGGVAWYVVVALGVITNAVYDAIKDPKGTAASIRAGFNSANKD
jgi:hypothetical protein